MAADPTPVPRRVIIRDLNRFTAGVMTRLVVETHRLLVRAPGEGGTPVDTGWARSNWIASVGVAKNAPVGAPDSINGSAAEQALAAVVSSYRVARDPIYLTNNVPYIGRLNAGSSKQAPAGFVQRAIAQAVSTTRRSVLAVLSPRGLGGRFASGR